MCVHRTWHDLNDLGIKWPEKLWRVWARHNGVDLNEPFCVAYAREFALYADEPEFARQLALVIATATTKERADVSYYGHAAFWWVEARDETNDTPAETRALP